MDLTARLQAALGDGYRREIKLAASLQHPHIVPLLHAGRSRTSRRGRAS